MKKKLNVRFLYFDIHKGLAYGVTSLWVRDHEDGQMSPDPLYKAKSRHDLPEHPKAAPVPADMEPRV
jgi:hypothetical protein